MAVGVLFISQTPGFNVELTNFLIGNILWVSPTDLYILFRFDLFILAHSLCLHKRFLAICFDEEQARLRPSCELSLFSSFDPDGHFGCIVDSDCRGDSCDDDADDSGGYRQSFYRQVFRSHDV